MTNDPAPRNGFHDRLFVLALAAAAAAIPAVALGNPPATGAPSIPGPFSGAPTNGDPHAGQFSIDLTNRSIGRAPGHDGRSIVTAPLARRQARTVVPASGQRRVVDRLFVTFAGRLKTIATPQTANATDSVDISR